MTGSEPSAPPVAVWDIVSVPFPYTDRPTRQRRPALVVRRIDPNREISSVSMAPALSDLLWVLMITSAENRGWPGDVAVSGRATGLPMPSLIRTTKIATVAAADARRIGHVPTRQRAAVLDLLRGWLYQASGIK